MEAFLKGKKLSSAAGSSKPKQKDESGSSRPRGPIPWVEKYRPKTVDDVAMQDEVVAVLKKSLQGADLPNLLFYGPPGTGKTSTILALARELFGEMYRSRILELNASDERGIDVVRKKVKGFAQQTAGGVRADGAPCPPFKIIILDEADSMTKAAQAALRRTMEKESRSTRFCLICNYVSRIIEPLTSRCSKFRFKPLAHEVIVSRLKSISGSEGVECSDEALGTLVKASDGDMRRAVTMLQSTHRLRTDGQVSWKDVLEVAGIIPEELITGLLKQCARNSFSDVDECLKEMFLEGYSASQMLLQIHDYVLDSDMQDLKRAAICLKIAECDSRLLDGSDEYLQIMDLCCVIMKQHT